MKPEGNVERAGFLTEAEFLQMVDEDEADNHAFRRVIAAIFIIGTTWVAITAVGIAVAIYVGATTS